MLSVMFMQLMCGAMIGSARRAWRTGWSCVKKYSAGAAELWEKRPV